MVQIVKAINPNPKAATGKPCCLAPIPWVVITVACETSHEAETATISITVFSINDFCNSELTIFPQQLLEVVENRLRFNGRIANRRQP